MKKTYIAIFVILTAVSLSSCSSSPFKNFKSVWSKDKGDKEEEKRIPILQNGLSDVKADETLQGSTINLPDAWNNDLWPQYSGFPNRAMGQLTLAPKLKKRWTAYIGSNNVDFNPLTIQPIVAENLVFTLDNRSHLSAFDLKEGDKKWEFAINPPEEKKETLGGGLAYSSGKLYATNGYKQLLCINPADGKLLWRKEIPYPAKSAPTVSDGRIYVVTLNNNLMVFSEESGEILWTYSGIEPKATLLGAASPSVNTSIVVLPMSSGELIGLRPENGQVVWQDNLSASNRTDTMFSIADVRAQPIIDQGLVYASSFSGRMVAIDEITGQRVWQHNIGTSETPWSAGDALFMIDNNQKLMAINRMSGKIYWIKDIQPQKKDSDDIQTWKGPVFAGGRLIIASTTGKVIEINPQNGELINKFKIDGGAVLQPVVANGTLIILTEDGELIAYR